MLQSLDHLIGKLRRRNREYSSAPLREDEYHRRKVARINRPAYEIRIAGNSAGNLKAHCVLPQDDAAKELNGP